MSETDSTVDTPQLFNVDQYILNNILHRVSSVEFVHRAGVMEIRTILRLRPEGQAQNDAGRASP